MKFGIEWSADDGEFVATCSQYPGLTWMAETPADALQGMLDLMDKLETLEIKDAMAVLTGAMQTDDEYAHGWHCNLAMSAYDVLRASTSLAHEPAHEIGNQVATRFMQLAFKTETSQNMLDTPTCKPIEDIST